MKDSRCVNFLQWALPRLNLRWQGFRRVRRQVCRRLDKRIAELQLMNITAYQKYLREYPDEWNYLDRMCRITISRFYRDKIVFDYLAADVIPLLIDYFRKKKPPILRVWSCGCASGEEPYTLAIIWHYMFRPQHPEVRFEIIATDIDPVLLERAQEACYSMSSIRFLPAEFRDRAFEVLNGSFCLRKILKKYVRFKLQDIRHESPGGKYQVVLCRNLAFTYFDRRVQEGVLERLSLATEKGGVLITGRHEPITVEDTPEFEPWDEDLPIFRKI